MKRQTNTIKTWIIIIVLLALLIVSFVVITKNSGKGYPSIFSITNSNLENEEDVNDKFISAQPITP